MIDGLEVEQNEEKESSQAGAVDGGRNSDSDASWPFAAAADSELSAVHNDWDGGEDVGWATAAAGHYFRIASASDGD